MATYDAQGPAQETDAEALTRRRAALRGFVDEIAAHIQTLRLPETWLEAERAARCVTVHDRALQILPQLTREAPASPDAPASPEPDVTTAVQPLRRLLRRYADRVMEAATFILKPDSFLEGERAGRYALAADRMLSQLYEEPKAPASRAASGGVSGAFASTNAGTPAFADDVEDEDDTGAQIKIINDRISRLLRIYAAQCGCWPDGTPCEPGDPEPENIYAECDFLTIKTCLYEDADPYERERYLAHYLINRVNGITRAMCRHSGRWPDDSPYAEDDPDYYSISSRYDAEVHKRPPPDPPPTHTEIYDLSGFPWWLVHKIPANADAT